MANNVYLLREVQVSSDWYASLQSSGSIVLHNFPSDATLENMDPDFISEELHFDLAEQRPLLQLLKLSEQESTVQDALPKYVMSKRLHGDVWVMLDEEGCLTLKSDEGIMRLSNMATRGLLNFFHKQTVQDVVRMGG